MNGIDTVSVRELVLIGEAELTTGPFGTQLKAGEYVESGVPLINVRNIGFGQVRTGNLEYLSDETALRLDRHKLGADDIVFGRKGAVERHAYISAGQVGWVQGSDCIRLRLSSARFIPRFVSYFLLTDRHQQWMKNHCSGAATMASLNQEILGRIELPTVDLRIQRKIASILSAYDDLIENNNRRINLLKEMAQRIYREWFIDFRYPGHETGALVESELGAIPKGWITKRVSDRFDVFLGGTPSRKNPSFWTDGAVPWINSGQINKLRVIEASEMITPEALSSSSTKLMPRGTTLLAITGATLGQVSLLEIEACANQSVVGICDASGDLSEYLYLAISNSIESIIGAASGGAQQHINQQNVKDICVLLPDRAVGKLFQSSVQPLFSLLTNLLFANQSLEGSRDLLLPRLMSGQIDVSDLDISKPEPAE